MNAKIENISNITIVNINEPKFTNMIAADFRSKIEGLIKEGNLDIIINLEKITYMDSSGLGAVISGYNEINDYNSSNDTAGRIVVCGLSQSVDMLFSMLKVKDFISIYPDKSSAIESFA